ncbi:MAG TPA: hypothetical protein VN943_10810 [Candidatus Acidoferrum sp.]|nr:hypothetical protein [Candidatus Acidoferrum sp.]
MMKKKNKKKNKKSGKKRAASKSGVSVKARLRARSGNKKSSTKRKRAARRRRVRENEDVLANQSIEKVPLSAIRPKARSARVGGGAGDYRGVSVVEGADFESPKELLEEGQAFEAGIVDGVQNAPNADRGEVRTREVPMDDVPPEYDDQDRP